MLLYRNFGATEKALACAARMPALRDCRELLRASAADGKAEAEYVGEALLEMASSFSSQLVYGLICNRQHYETDMPIEKVKGAIALFSLLCDDGNLGPYHGKVIQLYLYLSRLQWERGYQAEAFASLDEALAHARALEALSDGQEHRLTAPAGPIRALPKRSRAACRRAASGGLALLVQSRPDADGAGNAARPAVGGLGQTHAELTRQKSRRQRRDVLNGENQNRIG